MSTDMCENKNVDRRDYACIVLSHFLNETTSDKCATPELCISLSDKYENIEALI